MSVENRLIKSRLLEQEEVISRGYIDCGKALMVIRDERLYRLEHKSFESYVKERWEFTKSRANQLIEATTIVVNLPVADRPKNEAQARELAKVPEAKRAEVMAEIKKVAASEAREVTAKDIKSYVTEPKLETRPTNIATDGLEYSDVEDNDDDDETIGSDQQPKAIELSTLAENLIPDLMARFQDVTNLKKKLKVASVQAGGEWLNLELNEINEQLSQVQYKIKMAKFAATCPHCRNDKKAKQTCVVCRTYGWIAESRVEFAKNYGAA